MAITQHRSKRKPTGGRYKAYRGKRLYEKGSPATNTRIGSKKTKLVKGRGFNYKFKALRLEEANVFVPKEKKYVKAELKNVLENPANRNYARRNIITKGAIIESSIGKIKVTNRPGQEGFINAILIE